jgi:hypothetical protein
LGGTQANNRHSAVQWTNSQSSFGAFASGSIIVGNHIRTSGAGSINLIAGWNGGEGDSQLAFDPQTAWDFYVGGGNFGRNSGSIFIGSGVMTRHIEVGSRFGDTNIAGFDVTVAGSDTPANNRYAMIGFKDGGQVFAPRLNRGTDGGATEIRLDMRVGAPGGTGAWYLSDGRNSTNLTPGQVTSNQPIARCVTRRARADRTRLDFGIFGVICRKCTTSVDHLNRGRASIAPSIVATDLQICASKSHSAAKQPAFPMS